MMLREVRIDALTARVLSSDKVMHACLPIDETQVMRSEGFCSGTLEFSGVSLSLNASENTGAMRLLNGRADAVKIIQTLAPSFFASSFGRLDDRFGDLWMVPLPMPASFAGFSTVTGDQCVGE